MVECKNCGKAFLLHEVLFLKTGAFICPECYGLESQERQKRGYQPEPLKTLSLVEIREIEESIDDNEIDSVIEDEMDLENDDLILIEDLEDDDLKEDEIFF